MKNAAEQLAPSADPILIVDDEQDNLDALRRLLRNHFAVTVANSPLDALKLVQREPFHVIISDQRMPEMTGVEFLEKVKTLRPNCTRILLTGYTDVDSVIGAINRGNIYRYITSKPWDPEDLRLTLRQANEAYLMKVALQEKNEELSRKNTELNKALSELQVLDKAKARFLSLVSHELNTPLTVIHAFVSLLMERKSSLDREMEKAVSSLSQASVRFGDIVGEVLTYVKLEAGSPFIAREVNLLDMANSLKKELSAQIAE